MTSYHGLLLLPLLVLPAACFRVQHTSRPGTVTQAMLGAWTGDWQSSQGTGQGAVQMRVQLFEGQPVLQLDLANPCLEDGNYELQNDGTHMELLRNGLTVFSADLDLDSRTLAGTYQCARDRGRWSADWSNDLPPLGDIGGLWTGTFSVPGTTADHPFTMQIDQVWDQGLLAVHGEVVVEGFGTGFALSQGQVVWNDDQFEMTLVGRQLDARATVQGTGSRGTGLSATGFVLVENLGTPVAAGTWSAMRQ